KLNLRYYLPRLTLGTMDTLLAAVFFACLSLSVGLGVSADLIFAKRGNFFVFLLGRQRKLFDKALVVAWACAALAMCLLLALAYSVYLFL
ncbi:MAG TPA: hypothetical protein PKU77_12610, partial [Ferruginibacter sp.]|nr:hypothetical protein [Ferruginibacter sp.]